MKLKRLFTFIFAILFLGVIGINLMGYSTGIFSQTRKTGFNPTTFTAGCGCHGPSFPNPPSASTVVTILGPSLMAPGDTALFKLIITSNDTSFHAGGTDIATYYGDLYTLPGDTTLRRGQNKDTVEFPGYELTHTQPIPDQNDSVVFNFKYIAPMMEGVYDTIYGNGNAVDFDGSASEFDKWNYANNFVVHVMTTSIGNNNGIASEFKLEQNYPNPFNPSTNINFSISKASNLSLSVFDLSGKEVARLINDQYYSNGDYSVKFEASNYNLTSGVYFYKLSTGDISEVKKMVLIK